MTLYVFFTFGLILASSNAGIVDRNSLTPRIINGRNAEPGELPYQVSLQTMSNFHFCGGTILNEAYVITAAHCIVSQTPAGIKVVAGTLKLSNPKSTHYVEKIIKHNEYDAYRSWINDIAVIKVKTPFVMSNEIKMIPLPRPGMIIKMNQRSVVSGWGKLEFGGPTADHLQLVDIFIANQTLCRKMYESVGYTVYVSQICANDRQVKKGACHGDSGGPLTVNGILVGIVSWSKACAQTDYPSVYTRVSKFLDWIEENAF